MRCHLTRPGSLGNDRVGFSPGIQQVLVPCIHCGSRDWICRGKPCPGSCKATPAATLTGVFLDQTPLPWPGFALVPEPLPARTRCLLLGPIAQLGAVPRQSWAAPTDYRHVSLGPTRSCDRARCKEPMSSSSHLFLRGLWIGWWDPPNVTTVNQRVKSLLLFGKPQKDRHWHPIGPPCIRKRKIWSKSTEQEEEK